MKKALVTGCAGFIGSHLVERLLAMDVEVVGVDVFTPYYPRTVKVSNMERFARHAAFTLVEADVVEVAGPELLRGVDTVFHLAAQPGVRYSWSAFDTYLHHNLLATQRLLAAASGLPLERFVMASSSSVYGNAPAFPTPEEAVLSPVSPYGVTKQACEQLAWTYWRSEGLPVVALRFFTVYGPRQRPDMAFNIFIRDALEGRSLPVFGDGLQTRDFTFVADIVEGMLQSAIAPGAAGLAFNLGGGARVSLNHVLEMLAKIIGRPLKQDSQASQKGDARDTGASLERSCRILGYQPKVSLEEGLRREVAWMVDSLASQGPG